MQVSEYGSRCNLEAYEESSVQIDVNILEPCGVHDCVDVVCFVDEDNSSVGAAGVERLEDSWGIVGAIETWLDGASLLVFGTWAWTIGFGMAARD